MIPRSAILPLFLRARSVHLVVFLGALMLCSVPVTCPLCSLHQGHVGMTKRRAATSRSSGRLVDWLLVVEFSAAHACCLPRSSPPSPSAVSTPPNSMFALICVAAGTPRRK